MRYLNESYEHYYANKLENLGEMGNFLQRHILPKPTQEEIENLNRSVISKDVALMFVKFAGKKKKKAQATSLVNYISRMYNTNLTQLFSEKYRKNTS